MRSDTHQRRENATHRLGTSYCSRSAISGSVIAARQAGTNAATMPTLSNAAPAAKNAIGSMGLTPYRKALQLTLAPLRKTVRRVA